MPARKKARRQSRPRRDALVHSHLKKVSGSLLDEHWDVVRKFIGRNAGIYALYKRGRLYYVGLASGLASRLKAHTRYRHRNKWDQFSIYLTINDRHLKEIENLALQIAAPKGNKLGGKLAGSKDIRRQMRAEIRKKQNLAVSSLFDAPRTRPPSRSSKSDREANTLTRLLPAGARLSATNRGKTFRARARRDGRVRYKNKIYASLSAAAAVALKRPTNGWWFWQVERGKGNWTRLTKVRRAGTPVYPS